MAIPRIPPRTVLLSSLSVGDLPDEAETESSEKAEADSNNEIYRRGGAKGRVYTEKEKLDALASILTNLPSPEYRGGNYGDHDTTCSRCGQVISNYQYETSRDRSQALCLPCSTL